MDRVRISELVAEEGGDEVIFQSVVDELELQECGPNKPEGTEQEIRDLVRMFKDMFGES